MSTPPSPAAPARRPPSAHLETLNDAQRRAVCFGLPPSPSAVPPLLVIAGAGTGKTTTLAHRVAECVLRGGDPGRVLLLTFTRRAARQMTRHAERIVAQAVRDEGVQRRVTAGSLRWAGTFHAVANRLLRLYGVALGLDPAFTVLDRSDAEDLLDVARHRRGLSDRKKRFPRKGTCLAIYSRCVNSGDPVEKCLADAFPWCADWADELRALFRDYVDAKQQRAVLDYDDLLLYWFHLVQEQGLARQVAKRFDYLFVDEYQDTNALQASILLALCPAGRGLTVVGDDAQSIYAFRAATVRNILDFPAQFEPAAEIITLERNYRSTQPVLDAANAVIGFARERFTKNLFSDRASSQKPRLVTVEDETDQVAYVVEQVLEAREAGIALQQQAVLFRTAHHSDLLQVELSRRNIPFVMYGGLRFLEAAHVKDLLCLLRWAENPRDEIAAFRTLQLLPGIGPAVAQKILDQTDPTAILVSLAGIEPPAAARDDWPALAEMLGAMHAGDYEWPGQIGAARRWYEPHLARLYEAPTVRSGDLEQMEVIAAQYPSRERFLTELTLDPPSASGDLAGVPHLDEDFLVLSTIHSAKGREWECVHVLNVVDGCIPSDMASGSADEIEEERRLLYVAMTRAKDDLHLIHPLRFYAHRQPRRGDRHMYAPRSRFVPTSIIEAFDCSMHGTAHDADSAASGEPPVRVDVARRLREMW